MKTISPWIVAATLAASSLIYTSPAEARELGGVDLDRYCKNRFGNRASATRVEETAWGWRCRVGRDLVTISVDNACRFQYEDPNAYAQTSDPSRVDSWRCFVAG